MCVCVYMYMYICICVYIYKYIFICTHIIDIYRYMHHYTYTKCYTCGDRARLRRSHCAHALSRTRMLKWVQICTGTCVSVHVHTHTFMHVGMHIWRSRA